MDKSFLDYVGFSHYTEKLRDFFLSKLVFLVPKTRTVNSKPLTSNLHLTAEDVGAAIYESGDGMTVKNDVIQVDNPNRGIMLQEEFDLLREIDKKKGTFFLIETNDVDRHVFGVSWNGSPSSQLIRTDDSYYFSDPVPAIGNNGGYSRFDTIMPWSGMVRVNQDGNELVAIPKYWIKLEHNPLRIQISNIPKDGFQVSPAHRDRGDGYGERDVVYVGRYECNEMYGSTSGEAPRVSTVISRFRDGIHALGDEYWQADYALELTLWYLYIVEFANWNSENTIGSGITNDTARHNTGETDSMTYHTGRVEGTDGKTAIQYRGIENPFGNISEWRDGIVFSDSDISTYNNPAYFTNSYAEAGAIVRSNKRCTSAGWIKAWGHDSDDPSFIYPSAVGGSSLTYISDYYHYASGVFSVHVGGSYESQTSGGLFSLNGAFNSNWTNPTIGSRLQKLPNN